MKNANQWLLRVLYKPLINQLWKYLQSGSIECSARVWIFFLFHITIMKQTANLQLHKNLQFCSKTCASCGIYCSTISSLFKLKAVFSSFFNSLTTFQVASFRQKWTQTTPMKLISPLMVSYLCSWHRSLRDGGRVTKGGVEELAHHLP